MRKEALVGEFSEDRGRSHFTYTKQTCRMGYQSHAPLSARARGVVFIVGKCKSLDACGMRMASKDERG